ncbi:hypothetical protein UG55_1008127 [Frankia sp. EI5c]|uniref:GAP1-N2 domain-containing protein n=1 Tax=Frankia sp. EI5c TaxID=683316 RepID=UPI0007C3FDFD|nr:hypothetical protein [Frankia sp. EI5c]OAA27476.1 hypothetical protein UG55_1008127 [Frankia sp. EI5c]
MTIHQLHRTSASASGRPGWRVTAYTPGLGDAVRQQIVGLLAAELAVDARRTGPQRHDAEGSEYGPGSGSGSGSAPVSRRSPRRPAAGLSLSYSLLESGAALICRTVGTGVDFAGRPGNVFQHALLLTEPERDLHGLLPADLRWWPGWADQPSDGTLPAVERLVVDSSLPWREAVGRAWELHGEGRLAALLASARGAARSGGAVRIVLVEQGTATTMRTIRLVTGSLPRELALAMTFSVPVGHPEQSRHVLVGVPVGADLDPAAVPFGVRFVTHHLHGGPVSGTGAGDGAGDAAGVGAAPGGTGHPAPSDGGRAAGQPADLAWGEVAARVWAAGRVDVLAAASASFTHPDAAERLAAAAADAGVPPDQPAGPPAPGSAPPEVAGPVRVPPPAGAGPWGGNAARAARPRTSKRLPAGVLAAWSSGVRPAGSAIGGYARGLSLFGAGAVIAFGRLGARLLALPARTLAAGPPVLRPADGEAAYPGYFTPAGQALVDLGAIGDALADALRTARPALTAAGPTRWPGAFLGSTSSARRCWTMWRAGTATGATVAGGLARAAFAVFTALVVTTIAVARCAGAVLRATEAARWLLREARPARPTLATFRRLGELAVDCPYPDCARPLGRPFYECPNEDCDHRHNDLRPGRGGLLYRVCACGTRLRTWAPGRRGRLASYCGSCSGRLPDGIGHLPIVHIALIGPPASGKTTLLVAVLAGLKELAYQRDLTVSFAFRPDEEWYRRSLQVVADGGWLESTVTPNPRAFVVTVGIPRGPRRILFFFDPDGDLYTDQETLRTTHRYLERTHNALLVVDPSAQPALLSRLTPTQREAAYEAAHPAAEPTYDTMRRLIRVLHADGALPRRGGRLALRLAVVVSKTDWLRGLPPVLRLPDLTPEQQDGLVRYWLTRPARLPELGQQPSTEFTDTRYWALSAADCIRGRGEIVDPAERVAAAEPVLWMLGASGRGFRRLIARQQKAREASRHRAPHATTYRAHYAALERSGLER